MRFDDITIEPTRVTFWGPRAALEVRSPLPGVLRLRHLASLRYSAIGPRELSTKQSWAVVEHRELPLSVRREEQDRVAVVVTEELSVEVKLDDGTWLVRDAAGRELSRCDSFSGEAMPDYPVNRFRSRIALYTPPDESWLGFGEKVGALDKRGMHFVFWNTDVIPHHPDTDPLYQSIPFSLGLRNGLAWGFFLDESWRMEVDVAAQDGSLVQWESSGPELDAYVFAGPMPADVVRRYTALTGLPPLPPLWSLGAQQSRWGYENERDIRSVLHGYRAHQLPLDCIYLDIDYMEGYKVWTWDRSRYPDPAGLAREAASQGVRLVTIIDPGVKAEPGYRVYDEALAGDYLVRNDRGSVLIGEVWPKPAVFPDFTREPVRKWWAKQHRDFIETGIAGFWNDMNEPACFKLINGQDTFSINTAPAADLGKVEGPTLPHDARHGDRRHLEVHNVYAIGMARAAYEGMRELAPERRPFLLTRAGSAGIQRYSAVWTGDNSSYWAHLDLSIAMLLGLGLSGVSFTGVDVPGFLGRASGEMLARWMQVGTFYPMLRNHSGKGTPPQEPWRFGEPYLSIARQALERRYRLLPTLYTLMHEASVEGLPVMRPLVMYAPGDAEALRMDDSFLFGRDLLVTPVVRQHRTRRHVYLPEGQWQPFFNLAPSGEIVSGRQHTLAEAPLDTVPLWLRAGGALALTEPAMHTTTANWSHLTWHIHAAPRVEGRLYEDAGDGYGASRLTRLVGESGGDHFMLERIVEGELPLSRQKETLCVYGLSAPRKVMGAREHRFADGVLTLELDAGWKRVEVVQGS
ncbi:glycoside hydrolase family 31 protein [Vitiosangium sp. GDMCC 1.1324]|uniref:glycoside hydrolase family 31 protein n=1 Tax=Vitiosangium sp. (strain GDMCC 1.1324) TaxID=2138576 RepID=UPI000D380447|nr:glycoside hydrolase family 31 protein [Vitiosangium sp. GDMCC 1.1324]PTL85554.1 alpha-glucosidase [Vitiosangium sp. GDMCC 1.1324]